MISKPLLKQSIKANGVSWLLVTLATALMLGIIVIVLGSLQANEIRDSLKDTFVESELEAYFKSGAIDGFVETYETVEEVYSEAKSIYDLTTAAIITYELIPKETPNRKVMAIETLLEKIPLEQKEQAGLIATQVLTAYEMETIPEEKLHEFKSSFVIELILSSIEEEMSVEAKDAVISISKDVLDLYEAKKEDLKSEDFQVIARLYVEKIFYSNLLAAETEETKEMLIALEFQTMEDLLNNYGFTEIKVNALVSSGIIQYMSFINNNMSPEEAKNEVTDSLLSQMPKDVAESLTELGELNINHLVIGSIFYKIAGLLLPIVYTITTANNLIARQIDSGSMAYVLSTPTKRRKVTITQMVFLIGSLILMFLIIGAVGIITTAIVGSNNNISYGELLKLNIGALVTMIAISGICFIASAWFNRSKYAVGVGGGLSMFFLVSTILGLFGSNSIPEALRIEAMNFFNYTSIISLFNVNAILEGGTYIPGLIILLVVATITYTIGIIKFDKKDLPL